MDVNANTPLSPPGAGLPPAVAAANAAIATAATPLASVAPAAPKLAIPPLALGRLKPVDVPAPLPDAVSSVLEALRGGEVIASVLESGPSLSREAREAFDDLIEATEWGSYGHFERALQRIKSPQEKAQAVSELLKHFALRERGVCYAFIMYQLRTLFPDINLYVDQINVGSEAVDILSSRGIREIINILRQKGSIAMPCVLCESYDEFRVQLLIFIHSTDSKMAFIVRNQHAGALPPVTHTSPVLIEKTPAGYQCIITDSLGTGNIYGTVLASLLNKYLTGLDQPYIILSYMGRSRQSAPTNCTIFSLRDAANGSQDPSLFERYLLNAKQCIQRHPDPHVHYFEQLSPAMMKTTQSLTRIQDYDAAHSNTVVYDSIRHHLLQKESKTLNSLIEERFLKYLRLLIAAVIRRVIRQRSASQ